MSAQTLDREQLTRDQLWRLDELTERARKGNPRVKLELERLTARLLGAQRLTSAEAAEEMSQAIAGRQVGQGGAIPLPALLGLTGSLTPGTRQVKRYDVETIKRNNPPAQVLGRYGVTVRGKNCRCPVHRSRGEGVMQVEADHVYCHSCGFHGSAIDLVMALEEVGFREACAILGGTTELTVVDWTPPSRPKEAGPAPVQRNLSPLAHAAHVALWEGVANGEANCIRALEYLTVERGFTEAQLVDWGIGLITPVVSSTLLPFIRDADRTDERWRGRITIPCRNQDGSVYTVKARSVGAPRKGEDKYFNPARTSVRPFLWGQLPASGEVLIVEGELDALSALAAGIGEVIAVPGVSALSEAHAQALAARRAPVYLLLDPDTLLNRTILGDLKDTPDRELPEGPARAARRLARRLLEAGCDLRLVLPLAGGVDLNATLAEHGADVLLEQLVQGLDAAVSLSPARQVRRAVC